MSWQASAWAANIPHGIVGYVAFRTLALLANDAKEDGTVTWLEAPVVAHRLDVSERTAERAYKELREARVIRYGDQRYVAHLPAGKRPPVYDLTMLSRDDLIAWHEHREAAKRAGRPDPAKDPNAGPTSLSARPVEVGPTDLSAPTTGVAVNKEALPVKNINTQRNQQTAGARDGELVEADALDGLDRWAVLCPAGVRPGVDEHEVGRFGRCLQCGAQLLGDGTFAALNERSPERGVVALATRSAGAA